MFSETHDISCIISDTIRVVFKRRLVDRVLRLWTEMARGQGFPRLDQNRALSAGRGLGELPRDRRAITCPAFILPPPWGKLILCALSRRESDRGTSFTSAPGR